MGTDPKNARRAPKEQQRAQGSTQQRTGQRKQEHQRACSLLQFETPPPHHPGSCQLTVRRVRVLRSGRGPSCPGTSGWPRPAHAQTNNERQTNKLKETGGMGRRKINRCQMSGADRRPVSTKGVSGGIAERGGGGGGRRTKVSFTERGGVVGVRKYVAWHC
jgi:hypothetical protein